MPETPAFDRPLITGTAIAGPVPLGNKRLEDLIEGIAIFVTLAVSAAVSLIQNRQCLRGIAPFIWDCHPFSLGTSRANVSWFRELCL